jgi:3-deoxy-D-manno-octulosonic-acid transferase
LVASSLRRARKRGYRGLIAARLLGGSPPPVALPSGELRWTLLLSTGLGETRCALWAARELRSVPGRIATLVSTEEALDCLRKPEFSAIVGGVAPFNNPFSVLLALWRWRPRAILFAELSENWHLVAWAALLGIPTLVLNVHLSQEVANRLRSRPFRRWRYRALGMYAVQGEIHRQRLLALGVPDARIAVIGPPLAVPAQDVQCRVALVAKWRALLRACPEETPVFVAGSTYPDEERMLLEVFAQVRQTLPEAILVLAPRYLERAGGIDSALRQSGLPFARRSELTGAARLTPVVLLDTRGELSEVYGVASAAFVGGSFLPGIGGHTPLEALAWGVPITIGPHHSQQTLLVERLAQAGVLMVCATPGDLHDAWLQSVQDRSHRERVRKGAQALQSSSRQVYARLLEALLASASASRSSSASPTD